MHGDAFTGAGSGYYRWKTVKRMTAPWIGFSKNHGRKIAFRIVLRWVTMLSRKREETRCILEIASFRVRS